MFSEALWIFVVLAAWVIGLQLLRRYRRKTVGYANHQAFKAGLPRWVKQLEFCGFAGALVAYVLLGCAGIAYLFHALHPHGRVAGLAAVLLTFAVMIPAIVLAMVTSNLISWFIPLRTLPIFRPRPASTTYPSAASIADSWYSA